MRAERVGVSNVFFKSTNVYGTRWDKQFFILREKTKNMLIAGDKLKFDLVTYFNTYHIIF